MPDNKISLSQYGESKIEIKQSVFIGQASRVSSPEEAIQFVAKVRDQYPDARHSCYAWIYEGDTKMQKYSDDGEPSGTAGLPMLSLLTKNEITDAVVVVTRYFGGILLGKGGLVRAYTDAASEALKAAAPVTLSTGLAFEIRCDYSLSDKILFVLKTKGWNTENIEYAADVLITTVCAKEDKDELIKTITDLTAGRSIPKKVGERELVGPTLDLF